MNCMEINKCSLYLLIISKSQIFKFLHGQLFNIRIKIQNPHNINPIHHLISGWAAADSDWSGRTWGSPYAIAVLDIGGFIQENQSGGSGTNGNRGGVIAFCLLCCLFVSCRCITRTE